MNKESTVIIWFSIGLVVLSLGCRTLDGLNLTGSATPTPTPISWPHSTFVPSQKSVRVRVGRPLVIETHHLTGMAYRLEKLEIFINGQPIRTEETSGQATFPPELAAIQIVKPEQAEPVSPVSLQTAPPACQALLLAGNAPLLNSPESQFPSAEWNVCYVWIGRVPGTYDLSMVATDNTGARSELISERIEVFDSTP